MRLSRKGVVAGGSGAGKGVWFAIVLGAGLGVGTAACGGDVRGVEVGERVPPYGATSLSGERVSFEDQIGRVVLVNVWATWCGPCRVEMPAIEASYERYRDRGFTVLAISIDTGPGSREKVAAFVEEYGLSFPVLLDPEGEVTTVLRTVGVPETFVLDRSGRIVKRLIGVTDWSSPSNRALIEELLEM